ncbi:MAG: hypothetical protein ACREP6_03035, partial [Candidatus Binataceae bacterium]
LSGRRIAAPLKAAAFVFALLTGLSIAGIAAAQQLDVTSIGPSSVTGVSGAVAMNQTAGVGNESVNTTLITKENGQLSVSQLSVGAFQSAATGLQASIGDGAFSGTTGVIQLNQVSGSGNIDANAAFIGIGSSGTALASINLSQMRGGADPNGANMPPQSVQASIANTAFSGVSGVAQVQQVSGNNNVVANTVSLHYNAGIGH